VWIRIRLWILIRILPSSCKNSKKNLDSSYFVILFEFLSLENDVNVASKSHKQKKLCYKICFFAGILKVDNENSRILVQGPDPNPDSLVRGMDPWNRIRIHTKMPCIRNTDFCLMIEGSGSRSRAGSGSIPLTSGSGSATLISKSWIVNNLHTW
jgi:hypothetical protein